jgi:hypothetical protein
MLRMPNDCPREPIRVETFFETLFPKVIMKSSWLFVIVVAISVSLVSASTPAQEPTPVPEVGCGDYCVGDEPRCIITPGKAQTRPHVQSVQWYNAAGQHTSVQTCTETLTPMTRVCYDAENRSIGSGEIYIQITLGSCGAWVPPIQG